MKANELGVPTFDAEVACGPYCYGGRVDFKPTTYPEHTEAHEVWVKGDDVAALAARLAEAERLLRHVDETCACARVDIDAIAAFLGTADSADAGHNP